MVEVRLRVFKSVMKDLEDSSRLELEEFWKNIAQVFAPDYVPGDTSKGDA